MIIVMITIGVFGPKTNRRSLDLVSH
jgi:hypothetical protein